MNSFTEKQRQVITDLAAFYWDSLLGDAQIPEEARFKMREDYIRSIIVGLSFDDYWTVDTDPAVG